MKKIRYRKYGRNRWLFIKRKEFTADGTRLILQDRINLTHPDMSERILWIADSEAYYSIAPLSSSSHDLLCFNYCVDALKEHDLKSLDHALVFGCGGGAIPRWLLEEYPSVSVDVVDRSSDIIGVCKKYFLKRWENSGRLSYHCIDAMDFEPPEYKYEFIFCDMFDGENLAPVVFELSFAEKIRGMLSDNGVLVINCGWCNIREVRAIYWPVFRKLKVIEREPWETEVLFAGL